MSQNQAEKSKADIMVCKPKHIKSRARMFCFFQALRLLPSLRKSCL